jgi:hypothetical protein
MQSYNFNNEPIYPKPHEFLSVSDALRAARRELEKENVAKVVIWKTEDGAGMTSEDEKGYQPS